MLTTPSKLVYSMKPYLNWLLIFVPITIGIKLMAPDAHNWIFIAACIAIVPLAGWLGTATEHLAHHTGDGIGGLLNATFGNAAELIIALMALQRGLHDVVKASLTGSIIGNLLLVTGLSVVGGGLKYKSQYFNRSGARSQATMLMLASIALVLPAMYHSFAGSLPRREHDLSIEISIVLLITYGFSLLFTLKTHKNLFAGDPVHPHGDKRHGKNQEPEEEPWSIKKSALILAGTTAMIALISEILVGSVEHAAESFGMTKVFVGVIVVAIIGNAAEHSTAVLMAMKNRMDLCLGIALGSSIQVAVFVAPMLVFASYYIGPEPMNLVFTTAEVAAIALSVLIATQITNDGESNWMEGVQLLALYAILGAVFYYLPEASY